MDTSGTNNDAGHRGRWPQCSEQKANILVLKILSAALICGPMFAQAPASTTLTVDLQNVVEYQQDIADPSQFATNPAVMPAVTYKNFGVATLIGDIVAVNGQPAKGTYVGRSRSIVASPAPAPGGAIADITRTALREHVFEFLQSDGTPVATLMSVGFSGGSPAPGVAATEKANYAIVGGTGAFLGARGQISGTGGTARAASMAEDPSYRRINGGTALRFIVHVIPMAAPQVAITAGGPAIVHSSDFSLVTASKPAAPGEILSLFATGLGPTNPYTEPGQPFPSNPLALANSPIAISMNGEAAEILAAVGYPGATDGWQVNFRVPPDAGKGTLNLQLSAAWISGTSVGIAVQ